MVSDRDFEREPGIQNTVELEADSFSRHHHLRHFACMKCEMEWYGTSLRACRMCGHEPELTERDVMVIEANKLERDAREWENFSELF